MKLAKYLANLGYGSRREVAWLIDQRRVTAAGGSTLTAADLPAHESIRVDGAELDPPQGSLLMLHKPVGYVCSSRDEAPVVYDLLPQRFRHRSPSMSPVGRLDKDTSGLLLLTDDGPLNHRITSPKAHVPKTYDVTLAEPLRGDEAALFASGTIMLASESTPLAPAMLTTLGPRVARVMVSEGRYHQVRRMFAAVGNHVLSLHRSATGALTLGELAPGAWRVLDAADRAALFSNDATRAP